MASKKWSYDEEHMAFSLYYLIRPDEIDKKGGDVSNLADSLGRTNRSVAMKLWNIASLDKRRVDKGRTGLYHASQLDKQMWEEFESLGDDFVWSGLELLDEALGQQGGYSTVEYDSGGLREGRESMVRAKQRINQNYFRNCLLQNYGGRCCLTHLSDPELLVASHIKPWAKCSNGFERIDPCNGLLLNALHDKAFDRGLITLSNDMTIIVSNRVPHDEPGERYFWSYRGKQIDLPPDHCPSLEFVRYHQENVFLH